MNDHPCRSPGMALRAPVPGVAMEGDEGMIVWKHIEMHPYSGKDVGRIGKIRVFSIHYEHGILRGESGHYVLVPLLPGFKQEEYDGKTLDECKSRAETMLAEWLVGAGLQEVKMDATP